MKAIRHVGKPKGMVAEYGLRLAGDSNAAVIDTLPPKANVTVRMELDGSPLQVDFAPLTRDFLDLATLVYTLDEVELRKDSPDYWSRNFDVLFPVKTPAIWEKCRDGLNQTLRTLAGDDYRFQWCPRPALAGYGSHRRRLPRGFDAACLFSGGLDSFLGAYRLLSEGKKLILVGHQADGAAASAQTELAGFLRLEFPKKLILVQCRVARAQKMEQRYPLPEKCEESHRPRSFLFLALAIAIANAAKLKQVYIPENGLIALNPPLGKSRLGTLSTRTAHPKFLGELAGFLATAGIYTGKIRNPFLFASKTDMMKGLPAKLAAPLKRSVSCARPTRYQDLGVRHCGYCVPCIYRRVAMVELGLDEPASYAFDLFADLAAVDAAKRLDFRSLVAFAQRMISGTPLQRELTVLAHGAFPLSAAAQFGPASTNSYAIWGDMLQRWSKDFLDKLDILASIKTKQLLGI